MDQTTLTGLLIIAMYSFFVIVGLYVAKHRDEIIGMNEK